MAGIGPIWRAGVITPLAMSTTEIDLEQLEDFELLRRHMGF